MICSSSYNYCELHDGTEVFERDTEDERNDAKGLCLLFRPKKI